jgi:membrane protein implicated in regulation of membrane protease activity
MALGYRTRRRLSLLVLVLGLPAYVVAAVSLTNWYDAQFGRLPIWGEFILYVVLGFLWALPFKRLFRGVGQPDPDQKKPD